jgi:hypothetical protein
MESPWVQSSIFAQGAGGVADSVNNAEGMAVLSLRPYPSVASMGDPRGSVSLLPPKQVTSTAGPHDALVSQPQKSGGWYGSLEDHLREGLDAAYKEAKRRRDVAPVWPERAEGVVKLGDEETRRAR